MPSFFSKAADKNYNYQLGSDKGNERGFYRFFSADWSFVIGYKLITQRHTQ